MKIFFAYTLFFVFTIIGCTSKIDFEVVPPVVVTPNTDVLISEISTAINTDPNAGGARSHYVELYNGTAASVNLADYAIGYFAVSDLTTLSNFNFSSATNFLLLTGNLDKNKCYVIASPQADRVVVKRDTSWGTNSTLSANASSPLQLSGNSGIALLKKDIAGTFNLGGTNYKIIDVFGSPLVARITSTGATSARNNIIWSIAGEVADTRNRTFWRKSTVKDPSTNWDLTRGTTADNAQWRISGDRLWDYTNVGLPTP